MDDDTEKYRSKGISCKGFMKKKIFFYFVIQRDKFDFSFKS